jgi:hypothetical protein
MNFVGPACPMESQSTGLGTGPLLDCTCASRQITIDRRFLNLGLRHSPQARERSGEGAWSASRDSSPDARWACC